MSTYEEQEWADGILGGTPLSDDRLNHIEDGLELAHSLIADRALTEHTHLSVDITDATSANTASTVVKRDVAGFIAVSGITGLSTATSPTQAIPKSQFDSGLAAKAAVAHTHLVAEITDVSTVGAQVASAADAAEARDVLDVDSTTDVAAAISSAAADAVTDAATYTDAATDTLFHLIVWSGTAWGIRPNTSGTNQKVGWLGLSTDPVPTDGTAAGGTAKAAPGDLVIYR